MRFTCKTANYPCYIENFSTTQLLPLNLDGVDALAYYNLDYVCNITGPLDCGLDLSL